MAYSLQLSEKEVLRYFRERTDLSRAMRIRLFTALHEQLGKAGDVFRENAELRLAPGSDCFRFDQVVSDEGRLRLFRFVVNDHAAEHGVLQVLFVDEV